MILNERSAFGWEMLADYAKATAAAPLILLGTGWGQSEPVSSSNANLRPRNHLARAELLNASYRQLAGRFRACRGFRLLWRAYSKFPVQLFQRHFARSPDAFGLFAGSLLGRLFIMLPKAHLSKHAFLLQLLLQKAQSLINIVIAHQNLQAVLLSIRRWPSIRGRLAACNINP